MSRPRQLMLKVKIQERKIGLSSAKVVQKREGPRGREGPIQVVSARTGRRHEPHVTVSGLDKKQDHVSGNLARKLVVVSVGSRAGVIAVLVILFSSFYSILPNTKL